MLSKLSTLLSAQQWFNNQPASATNTAVATGYAALDKHLHYKGLSPNSCVELCSKHPTFGAHLLSKIASTPKATIAFINPSNAINLSTVYPADDVSLFVVHTKRARHLLWSIEQAVKSRRCNAVITCIDHNLSFNQLRKLQLACEQASTPLFLLRPEKYLTQASAARVRLKIQANQQDTHITITKQPGGRSGQTLSLVNPYYGSFRKTLHDLPLFTSRHIKAGSLIRSLNKVQSVTEVQPRFNA